MRFRFCDETELGFSWIVDEPVTRTSHAIADEGRVWLVDPLDWPEAVERARAIGEPQAVLQLLDRHNRDCAEIARRLGVPHLVTPTAVPGSPFEVIEVRLSLRWHEIALWWPQPAALVVAECIGTNDFFTAGQGTAGVHLALRLTPPRDQLAGLAPQHVLLGHGEGLHGEEAATGLADALAHSRTGLPRALLRLPSLLADAYRRHR